MLKMTITGNLGKNAEVRTLQDGSQVISFNVGVRIGKEQTQWVSCAKFVKQGGSTAVANYLTKGAKVLCEGMPSASSYNAQDGTIRTDLKLRVYELELLGSFDGAQGVQHVSAQSVEVAPVAPTAPLADDDFPF